MDREPTGEAGQIKVTLPQESVLCETLALLSGQTKRRYTKQEIDEARGNLALMNDRVFLVTFKDNKNNHIVKGIVDAVRKIHRLAPIPPIEQTKVQELTLFDVLGRGMVGDLTGWGNMISIGIEAQKQKQDGYAVRGTLTAGNIMRVNFNAGASYTEAPDAVTINILDFRLPELKGSKMFCTRIVRAEYESRQTFLADKYSEYYIELPKLRECKKEDIPEEYRDLYDICCIFGARINEHEEVIRMQSVANPTALELSREVKKAAAPDEFVNTALDRYEEAKQFTDYILRQAQKAAQEARKAEAEQLTDHFMRQTELIEQKAAQKAREAAQKAAIAEQKAAIAEQKAKEEMIIMALKNNFAPNVIETMQKGAGITDSRLAELKIQAQSA